MNRSDYPTDRAYNLAMAARRFQMQKLRNEGASYESIGKEFGVSRQLVQTILKREEAE